jgi:proteasome lid subunit RPN8/RPN11
MADEDAALRRVVCGSRARATLLADVAARPRIEACGLLVGRREAGAWIVEEAVPLRNMHDAPDYFEFDPEELLRCYLEWDERLIGAYHSHPGGPARPSNTDLGNMRNHADSPWVWLILSPRSVTTLGIPPGGAWHSAGVAAFRVERNGRLVEYPVEFDDDDGAAPADEHTRTA